jgi:hypothetical protein
MISVYWLETQGHILCNSKIELARNHHRSLTLVAVGLCRWTSRIQSFRAHTLLGRFHCAHFALGPHKIKGPLLHKRIWAFCRSSGPKQPNSCYMETGPCASSPSFLPKPTNKEPIRSAKKKNKEPILLRLTVRRGLVTEGVSVKPIKHLW